MHLQSQAMECLAWVAERQDEAQEQLEQLDAQLRYCATGSEMPDPRILSACDALWRIWRNFDVLGRRRDTEVEGPAKAMSKV
jgi:hypothetical protein